METISLKDLQDLFNNKKKYLLNEEKGHIGIGSDRYDGSQGEYNETFRYYKHPGLPENIFMKETWVTDSYAENDKIESVEFVQGVAKTITVYEPIKNK